MFRLLRAVSIKNPPREHGHLRAESLPSTCDAIEDDFFHGSETGTTMVLLDPAYHYIIGNYFGKMEKKKKIRYSVGLSCDKMQSSLKQDVLRVEKKEIVRVESRSLV